MTLKTAAPILVGALCLGACAALAPVSGAWPPSHDHRVKLDGQRLRVYGASFKDAVSAEADARRLLRGYVASLDVPGEPAERAARVDAAVKTAATQLLGVKTGYACVAEIELRHLQETLGTHYALAP